MSPLEALAAARAAGVEVRLDGEDLIVSAASEPPDDICAMLSRHKTAIVELLQAAPADAAAALARRAQFKEQAAAVAALRQPTRRWAPGGLAGPLRREGGYRRVRPRDVAAAGRGARRRALHQRVVVPHTRWTRMPTTDASSVATAIGRTTPCWPSDSAAGQVWAAP